MKNYYSTLGLSFEANPEPEIITASYKALVKIYHPDVFKGDIQTAKRNISEINEAYEVLSDKVKKKKYDNELREFLKKGKSTEKEDTVDQDKFYEDVMNDDWEVALEIYPDLEEEKNHLKKFNKKLGLQFQFILLDSKEFKNHSRIYNYLLDSFLESKFGTSKKVKKLAKLLIEDDRKEIALEINKLVKILGSSSSKEIIEKIFYKHDDIRKEYSSKISFKTKEDNKGFGDELKDLFKSEYDWPPKNQSYEKTTVYRESQDDESISRKIIELTPQWFIYIFAMIILVPFFGKPDWDIGDYIAIIGMTLMVWAIPYFLLVAIATVVGLITSNEGKKNTMIRTYQSTCNKIGVVFGIIFIYIMINSKLYA